MGAQRLASLMKRGAQGIDSSYQAGGGAKPMIVSHRMLKYGGVIETQILVDLQGNPNLMASAGGIHSSDTDQDVIGYSTDITDETTALTNAVAGAHLLKWENDVHGVLFEAEIICIEIPNGTEAADVDVVFETYAAGNKLGTAITSPDLTLLAGGAALVAGDRHIIPVMDEDLDNSSPEVTAIPALTDVDGKGLYLTADDDAPGIQYTQGKLLIILRGYDNQWGF